LVHLLVPLVLAVVVVTPLLLVVVEELLLALAPMLLNQVLPLGQHPMFVH
jgi:hypothetical protein